MWLANDKFKEINHAVLKGEPKGLLKLFGELFHPDNQFSVKPTDCPQCKKPLEKKMHPYLEYFVQACPDRHGAWMSPDVSAKFRDFCETQINQLTYRKKTIRFLITFAAGSILFLFLANHPAVRNFSQQPRPISTVKEPQFFFSPFPTMTEEDTAVQNKDERDYLSQIARLLENAASNRIYLDGALKEIKDKEAYLRLFEVYKKNHYAFLMKLRAIYVPEVLQPFQQLLQKAGDAQLVFYGAFLEEKMRDPKSLFPQGAEHPALRVSSEALAGAADFLFQQYPNLDSRTRQAVEDRLGLFDID